MRKELFRDGDLDEFFEGIEVEFNKFPSVSKEVRKRITSLESKDDLQPYQILHEVKEELYKNNADYRAEVNEDDKMLGDVMSLYLGARV